MVRGRIEGHEAPYGGWVWFWSVLDTRAPVGFQDIANGVLDTWEQAYSRVSHWLELER